MSSSISTATAASTITHLAPSLSLPAQFREIHKNTWLKRLTSDGKKIITVGPKKSERSWVVFCVHDDTKALLEGYAEPRQAAQHNPEWIVSMQDTLHISHAIPNSNEFEFVVTLSNEVVRFHAISWEIMQEWVDTLRSKLREMKILSPRENIYTKLPEVRPPLLPTRDPTSPLPAPPPVPAAIVPGIERVIPQSIIQQQQQQQQQQQATNNIHTNAVTTTETHANEYVTRISETNATTNNSANINAYQTQTQTQPQSSPLDAAPPIAAQNIINATTVPALTSMSNTLTQNLLNMLSDPISNYSEQLHVEAARDATHNELVDTFNAACFSDNDDDTGVNDDDDDDDHDVTAADTLLTPLLRKCLFSEESKTNVDVANEKRASADQLKIMDSLLHCERLIPRPQTSRSLSAGAVDKSRKQNSNNNINNNNNNHNNNNSSCSSGSRNSGKETNSHSLTTSRNNNITELAVNTDTTTTTNIPITTHKNVTSPTLGRTTTISNNTTTNKNTNTNDIDADSTSNITIIQVSTTTTTVAADVTTTKTTTPNTTYNQLVDEPPKLPIKNITAEIFKFPDIQQKQKQHIANTTTTATAIAKIKQLEYKSNVQIIPSNSNNVNSSTIQVLGQDSITNNLVNKYSTPIKKNKLQNKSLIKDYLLNAKATTTTPQNENQQKSTVVHVVGSDITTTLPTITSSGTAVSIYGTCYTPPATVAAATLTSATATATATPTKTSTPKLPKKIIHSGNTTGITNITVNNLADDVHAGVRVGALVKNNVIIDSNIVAAEQNAAATTVAVTAATVAAATAGNLHYDKVFLSTSAPLVKTIQQQQQQQQNTIIINETSKLITTPMSPKRQATPRHQVNLTTAKQITSQTANDTKNVTSLTPKSTALTTTTTTTAATTTTTTTIAAMNVSNLIRDKSNATQIANVAVGVGGGVGVVVGSGSIGSPLLERRFASPTNSTEQQQQQQQQKQQQQTKRLGLLTRGLTEAVITTRPSRKDFHFLKLTAAKTKSLLGNSNSNTKNTNITTTNTTTTTTATQITNNNEETASGSNNSNQIPLHAAINRTHNETQEQRRRSSSTSDAQTSQRLAQHQLQHQQQHQQQRSANNNEFQNTRNMISSNTGAGGILRFQQPPQPFRSVENGIGSQCLSGSAGSIGGVSSSGSGIVTGNSPAAKRLTLREQQVMQLRREIMHPGGVKLQLRRKDCVGSIAWIDAFGAVWIAGWKQKEHPVLYNALHIGDQLLSIAGITITTAAEANKVIRNANTLFIEVLIRRLPFGRGYAIRREREGQCLGLIRDGNFSTIVDVVPNSLAARHGLPPKAQSCDGTTLTFWVLTEINGRPLNLFFKENEIRDRLNSVGRDISILVQPSDLITKLKKQLKSLRGYKDYLVQ